MGANTYLAHPTAFGYQANGTTGDIITQFIPPRPGERIAIRAFGFTAGSGVTSVYFMTETGNSTMSKACASNATTTMALVAEPTSGNALATSDFVAIELDNGTYQGVAIATGGWSDFSIAEVLADTVSTGNNVYNFSAVTNLNSQKFNCTASTQTTKELDGGLFYADGKNKAMLVYHTNDTSANAFGSIDYLTVDYINV